MEHLSLSSAPASAPERRALSRRHTYRTQIEQRYLLHALASLQRGGPLPGLLPLTEVRHEPEHALILATYEGASEGGQLPRPASPAARRTMDERALLALALDLAHALHTLHERDLLHLDLRPETVWIGADHRARLLAPALLPLDPLPPLDTDCEDHLVRRAPEWLLGQSRGDQRTDLYALGVLLYEQLAPLPSLPALLKDFAAYTRHPHLFERLSAMGNILLTLLQPDLTLRYQSARDLLADLEQCRALIEEQSEQSVYPRRQSSSGTLRIPDTLTTHHKALERIHRHLTQRPPALALLSGISGVGKSTLLRRLAQRLGFAHHRVILLRPRHFVEPLCMQLIEQLSRQLLYWPRHELHRLADDLDRDDLDLLTTLSPLLASLLHHDPSSALSARHPERVEVATHAFLDAFLQHTPSVILLVDDVDALPPHQRHFLARLVRDRSLCFHHLSLVLCAEHEDDLLDLVPADAPARRPMLPLTLEPLDPTQMGDFIQSLLGSERELAIRLASHIQPITQGIPLLMLHMLYNLHALDVLRFAAEPPGWVFDEAAMEAPAITEAIAEIITARLELLDPRTLETLSLVALSSPSALVGAVSRAQQIPLIDTHMILRQARLQGLLVEPSTGHYRLMHRALREPILSRYSLRQQQEAHARLLRALLHLLTHMPPSSPEELHTMRHMIAHHAGALLDAEEVEASELDLLELLFLAWQSTSQSGDGSTRLAITRHIVRHALATFWQRWPEEALTLTRQHARDLLQSGEAGEASMVLERALALHPPEALEVRLPLLVEKIELLTLSSLYEQALELGTETLDALGLTTTRAEDAPALEARCDEALSSLTFAQLRARPRATDPLAAPTAALLAALLPLTYINAPERFSAIVYTLVLCHLERGHTPAASLGYGCYGQLIAPRGEVARAYGFGELALELAERFEDQRALAIACSAMANYLSHWTRPLQESHEFNARSHALALRVGDVQYAGYTLMHDAYNRFFAQEHLGEVQRRARRYLSRCYQLGNQLATRAIEGLILLIDQNLSGISSPDPAREDDFIATCLGESNQMALTLFALGKAMLLYVTRELDSAGRYFEMARSGRRYIAGCYPENELISIIELVRPLSESAPDSPPSPSRASHRSLERLAHDNPALFAHKWLWLRALRCAPDENWRRIELIERAFEAAMTHQKFYDAALIRLRAAQFWRQNNKSWLSHTCEAEARDLLLRWGATRLQPARPTDSPPPHARHSPLFLYQARESFLQIDNALHQSADPELMLTYALEALTHTASATRASALLIHRAAEQVIQGAVRDRAERRTHRLSHSPLTSLEHAIPLHLVRLALHGQHDVLIDDARTHALTREDRELRAQGVLTLALIFVPLHSGQALLVYLDNDHLAQVFTEERLLLIRAQLPLLALALESVEQQTLRRYHPHGEALDPRKQRYANLLNVFQELIEKIHQSTMLIHHEATMISPKISRDLGHILDASRRGLGLVSLLQHLTSWHTHRVHDTLDLPQLVQLLVTEQFTPTLVPPREPLETPPRIETSTALLLATLGTLRELFWRPSEQREDRLTLRPHADGIALLLAPIPAEAIASLIASQHEPLPSSSLDVAHTQLMLVARALHRLRATIEADDAPDTLRVELPRHLDTAALIARHTPEVSTEEPP